MIIEKGKYYLQVKQGFVTDAVEYNPNLKDYVLYKADKLPADIMNQCYELKNGKLTLNQEKHAEFLAEQERQLKELEEME